MKPAPHIAPPRFAQSDLTEARKVFGCEPSKPVGVVVSQYAFAELQACGTRFPCPVAVDPRQPRETIAWIYLPENFQPFSNLVRL